MPIPPLSVDSFRNLASNCRLPDRDIVVRGANEARTVRLGNIVFTTAKATNVATMDAFKAALEAEYGVFGTQAFDTVLVRGEYSDGHPKLMLSAKYADDYKELEVGFLKDGHAVARLPRAPPRYRRRGRNLARVHGDQPSASCSGRLRQ